MAERMNSVSKSGIRPVHPEAALTACATIGLIWLGALLGLLIFDIRSDWTLWLIYPLPLLPVAMSLIVRGSLRSERVSEPMRGLLWFGLVWIIGGAFFDLFSTLWHSPDLRDEGNVILRELLDRGHTLQQVYLFGAAMNFVFTWMFCELWRGLTIHLPRLASEVAGHAPNDRLEFFKSATGGGHLTWRQWLVPIRPSEMPKMAFWIWPTVITVTLAASTLRWYAGLEWFGFFPPLLAARAGVLFAGATLGMVAYFAFIERMSRQIRERQILEASALAAPASDSSD